MTKNQRIKLALKSLKGVSVGDAFGESFFGETNAVLRNIDQRKVPKTTWDFTDDTIMAIAIYDHIINNENIKQDLLANEFALNHQKDLNRGYGATTRRILREISEGGDWKKISSSVFDGMGSMGNGASMRVSPIGAFYFDDLKKVKDLAIKSAEITHSNIEAITGAIAVAIATALATKIKLFNLQITPNDFIDQVVHFLPDSDTKSKIKKATTIPYSYNIETVKTILGNGRKIIAQNTVPFTIWCSAHNLNNFEEALWKGISVLGDRDTICAIIGGITIMSTQEKHIPKIWLDSVEKVETSQFIQKTI